MTFACPPTAHFINVAILPSLELHPGHARKVMHAIWALGQAMFSKCIVVVDDDVDVQNVREVTWESPQQYRSPARH